MTIFSLISLANNSFADDDFKWEDWEDLKISNSYDRNNEELKINFVLDDVDEKPEDKYQVKIRLDWEDYYENLDYNSSDDELKANFKIDIDKKDIEDEYKIRYYVKNKTEDTTVFYYTDYNLEIDWESWGDDDLDWKDLEVSNSYDEDDEELKIDFKLDNVKKKPKDDYKVKIRINKKLYKKNLDYNSSDDELTTSITINIDKDDIKDEYDARYYVENIDEDENEYSNKDYKLKVKKKNKNLDWKDLEISSSYDKDDEELKIDFKLEDIKKKPKDDYKIKLKLDWKSYKESLKYNSSDDELKASFEIDIDEDDIEDEYNVKYYVENIDDDETEYKNTNYKLKVGKKSKNKSLDWKKLDIYNHYSKSDEELKIEFELEDVEKKPKDDYKIKLKLDWKSYTEKLKYNSSRDKLTAIFKINIDKEDIEREYDMRYYVENIDEDDEEVYKNTDYKLEINKNKKKKSSGNKSGKKTDLDWKNINISSSYNKKKEKLYVRFYFEDIESPTYYTYQIKMYLDGISHTKTLMFDERKKELYLVFVLPIDKDDIEEYYNIKYYAINYTKDEKEYSNKEYKMYTDTEKRKKELERKKKEEEERKRKEEEEKNKMSAKEVALKSKAISNVLINKIEKYRTKTKIKLLEKFIKILKSYIKDYKNLEDLILATCKILEEEIDRLEKILKNKI